MRQQLKRLLRRKPKMPPPQSTYRWVENVRELEMGEWARRTGRRL